MEYAFIIELLPDKRSLFGIEMKTTETAVEYDGKEEPRMAYCFTLGLALIHFQIIIYRQLR